MFRALSLIVVVAAGLPAWAGPRVEAVQIEPRVGITEVIITASEPLTFQSWSRGTPPTIIVDMLDTTATPQKLAAAGLVQGAELSRHDGRGSTLSRLTVPLPAGHSFEVSARGNTIVLAIFAAEGGSNRLETSSHDARNFGGGAKPVLVATRAEPERILEGSMGRATATDAPLLAQARGARQMTYIGFKNAPGQSRIFARMNDKAEFSVRKEGDNLLVLEIQNATIPLRNNKNHLDTRYFDSPVKMITPSEVEDATPTVRITIEMKESVPYETKVEGQDIVIVFKKS